MLAMMVKEFNTQINHEKIGEAAEKTKMSIHDIVTIASMVELEAVFKEEQPRIAGVFLRRLKIYMPIQSDTTIQYILGGEQKAEITIADLNPENTDYLYFVAEKDGHHRFTRTYEEHLQAIENIHGPQ